MPACALINWAVASDDGGGTPSPRQIVGVDTEPAGVAVVAVADRGNEGVVARAANDRVVAEAAVQSVITVAAIKVSAPPPPTTVLSNSLPMSVSPTLVLAERISIAEPGARV